MVSKAFSPKEYIEQLPEDRKTSFSRLRDTILKNLPPGFEEIMNYGMIGYVVPHSLYPPGYHCNPELPLPFISIASQKNFIALYHMGIYTDEGLLNWFTSEYKKQCNTKLDMGKSCIRFKKSEQISFDLIAELCKKVTPKVWISQFENVLKR